MQQYEVKLPDIGEGVREGELQQWLVAVGDKVDVDQSVAEILTDKSVFEVPSPVAGVVTALGAKVGESVPVGGVLLSLKTEPNKGAPSKSAPSMSQKQNVAEPERRHASGPASALTTPSTRRLARELGVDLGSIRGTGLHGQITREDVLSHSAHKDGATKGAASHTSDPASALTQSGRLGLKDRPRLQGRKSLIGRRTTGGLSAPLADAPEGATKGAASHTSDPASALTKDRREPFVGIRRKIAEHLQKSKQVVPHFTIMDTAYVGSLVRVRAEAKVYGEKHGIKVTYMPFFMKALARVLRESPEFNASIDDEAGEVVYRSEFHMGFACDTPQGLLVPVVRNVEQKSMLDIAREMKSLSDQARAGTLPREAMQGGTVTLTNIGSVGGSYATPIINHPEVMILGIYKLHTLARWSGRAFRPAQAMNFSVSCDHRLIDGAKAARFLGEFISLLEAPSLLMTEFLSAQEF